MTIREALRDGEERLLAQGVPDARLDAEYLLAEVLRAPRLSLRLEKERQLTAAERAAYDVLLRRRETREPLQYILGAQPFMGLELQCDPRALIPRNDTECVCEEALRFLRPGMRALDLCTGTGAIAIAMKHACPGAEVWASDLSGEALDLARKNAESLGADLRFAQGDLFVPLAGQRFDLIVSNPPYIPDGAKNELQREVLFEPGMALFAGRDGLDFYRRIAMEAPAYLAQGGRLILETGDGQDEAVAELLRPGFELTALLRDMNGRRRGVSALLR